MIEEIDLQLFLDMLHQEGCSEPRAFENDGITSYRVVSRDNSSHTYILGEDEDIDREEVEIHLKKLNMLDLAELIPYKKVDIAAVVITENPNPTQ